MNEEHIVKALAALAHPIRLRIFRALVVTGTAGQTPSILAKQLDVASTALSFHLKELVNAGLVSQERVGRNLFYRAAYDEMNAVIHYLTENCCAGEPCGQANTVCCPTSTTTTTHAS